MRGLDELVELPQREWLGHDLNLRLGSGDVSKTLRDLTGGRNDLGARACREELKDDVSACDAWKTPVNNRDIVALPANMLDGLAARAEYIDAVSEGAQELREYALNRDFIFYNNDAHGELAVGEVLI